MTTGSESAERPASESVTATVTVKLPDALGAHSIVAVVPEQPGGSPTHLYSSIDEPPCTDAFSQRVSPTVAGVGET